MIDKDRLRQNLDWILAQVEDLEAERSRPGFDSEFRQRDLVAAGVRHKVLTAIQAMIDVCYHLAGKLLRTAPAGPGEALQLLVERGLLPAGHLATWRQMVGFRNRLVHEYKAIDPAIVAEILAEGLTETRRKAPGFSPGDIRRDWVFYDIIQA